MTKIEKKPTAQQSTNRQTQTGVIVSDKMDKTAVVEVALWRTHRILRKRFQQHRRFLAENPENRFHSGETVEISSTRPLSRRKHWVIVRKLDKQTGGNR